MIHTVYNFNLKLDWKLLSLISAIDRFDASWAAIEKREGRSLRELKSIATVKSVGASTRIEGVILNDDEVKFLIENLSILTLEDRDSQEVAGYFTILGIISESYADIEISESAIKNLHNILMKFSQKDAWHKGDYKQQSNAVEATKPDGSKQTIFKTAAPGFETVNAMAALIEWFLNDMETHPLVKCALFCYDFLSIHPFQDGNGRMSRLLATLLLLKHNYLWIQYVSFEHEIERNKNEYYRVLMECQQQRPGENVDAWLTFFLQSLNKIAELLMIKLDSSRKDFKLPPREYAVYLFIENNPGTKSGDIAVKLNIPLPTVKRILSELSANQRITRHGNGPGTNYTV